MPPDEYAHWVALESINEKRRKKEQQKARAKKPTKGSRR